MKLTVYFRTRNNDTIRRIRERFGMPMVGMTVNGELTCEIKDDDMPLLKECEKLGYVQIRNKKL